MGRYINANTPIKHYCNKHDILWDAIPENILKGCGCPKCTSEKISNKTRKTTKLYIDQLKIINPYISVVGEYCNQNTPILHKCEVHNIIWSTSPASILQGCGCSECKKERFRKAVGKTHEKYTQQVKEINPNIKVIEAYINNTTPILHECLIDGYKWRTVPSSILQGHGCPKCNQSHGERKISLWLDKHNIKFIPQYRFEDCKDIYSLPFDFFLPKYNKCIEYDGRQHFEPVNYFGGQEYLEYTQRHDNIKTEYCKNNGIHLLRISYDQDIEEELNNFLFI